VTSFVIGFPALACIPLDLQQLVLQEAANRIRTASCIPYHPVAWTEPARGCCARIARVHELQQPNLAGCKAAQVMAASHASISATTRPTVSEHGQTSARSKGLSVQSPGRAGPAAQQEGGLASISW